MPRYFTQYWKNSTWRIEPEEDVDHTADNRFRKRGVSDGDYVYIITNLDGQMVLGSRLKVAQIVGQAEAERLLGIDLYKADDHIMAEPPFLPLKKDRVVPADIAEELRFISKKADTLVFSTLGKLDNQTLRGVRELTAESAELLDSQLEKHRKKARSPIRK